MKLVEGDADFSSKLAGYPVLAYHATRLLDTEREAIRANGLRVLDLELICDRVAAAHATGIITAADARTLVERNALAQPSLGSRKDQICFFLPSGIMQHSAHGLWRLLSFWGGEAVYVLNQEMLALRSMGTPTIVVATLELGEEALPYLCFPGFQKLFLGSYLKLPNVAADLFYRSAVASERIVSFWQPGSREYDRYAELPRA